MTSSPPLLIERHGPVVWLCFNRPQALNALDEASARAFLEAMRRLAAEPAGTTRCVVIRGAGRAFMAGGDLPQMQADPSAIAERLIAPLHEALQLMTALDAPVVAQLHGAVAGGGMSLAMACDLAVAAESVRFNLAYARIGTSCDLGGSWALPRLVGLRRAMEIALLGDALDAAQALSLGLVNRVVPEAQLAAEVQALAARLAAGAPLALARIKRLLRQSLHTDLATQLEAERRAFTECAASHDFAEGLQAFFDKREPRFQGR